MTSRRPGTARRFAAVTLLVAVLALGGCTASHRSGTKAGPATPPVTLHLATVEASNFPYAEDVIRFADEVKTLTKGSVTIEIHWTADDPWTANSEQVVTGMVKGGKTDLALVPPRVFDTIGIHGFEALQTPMTIDSPELAGAISIGSIAADMLAGLSDDGLVGLGLFYDSLRRPLAFSGAFTAADQFAGSLIRVSRSDLSFDMFHSLGATPDAGTEHVIASTGQPYAAAETQLQLAVTDYPQGSTMTANMVFYPKFNALLANPGAFGRLSAEEREALRRAAHDTAVAAVETTADDEALAETACESGGHVLLADPAQIHAMRARVAPVVDRLRADPTAGPIIKSIESLAETIAVPAYQLPPACEPPTGDGAKLPTTPPPPAPPT